MDGYKLLIAEDEWMIADSLRTMDEWKDRNIDVIGTASSGEEAIQYLEREHVDIVITDIRMPGVDGLQLLQHIYEQKPHIHTVVISGYEEFDYARTALKYKATGYVLKPIDTDELLSIVDDILSRLPAASEEAASAADAAPRTYQEALVLRAKSFIQSRLDQPVSLSDAADSVHLTSHYFGQMFKTVTGESFVSYLTRIRMEKACELLRNPELKHYEISSMVGYADAKYFAKVFHKTYGLTPKDFRTAAKKTPSPRLL